MKNNDIRSEIVINKSVHQKEIRELTKQTKQKRKNLECTTTKMNEIKAKFNKQKGAVATRLFKMENKSKMYLGILKHWSESLFLIFFLG